ncbi:hypothetical protein DFH06DRAFT_1136518 [Mycena polygramma]|nr:hypothetical protein DFH06DRAFT_1136518 [Mycena polygramma]
MQMDLERQSTYLLLCKRGMGRRELETDGGYEDVKDIARGGYKDPGSYASRWVFKPKTVVPEQAAPNHDVEGGTRQLRARISEAECKCTQDISLRVTERTTVTGPEGLQRVTKNGDSVMHIKSCKVTERTTVTGPDGPQRVTKNGDSLMHIKSCKVTERTTVTGPDGPQRVTKNGDSLMHIKSCKVIERTTVTGPDGPQRVTKNGDSLMHIKSCKVTEEERRTGPDAPHDCHAERSRAVTV